MHSHILKYLPYGVRAVGGKNLIKVRCHAVRSQGAVAHDEVIGLLLGDGGDGFVGDIFIEAGHELGFRHDIFKILPVKVNYNALVGHGPVDLRLVDSVVLDQQHVPWSELVDKALHPVIHRAGNEDDQLVKVMKMEIQLLPGSILKMEIMIAFLEITRLVYAFLLFHRLTSLR